MPKTYAALCAGLTQSGVTKLDKFERGVITFVTNVVASKQLRRLLRRPKPVGTAPIAMDWLEGVAIHLYTLDEWENANESVCRVVNLAVSKSGGQIYICG